MSKEDPKYPRSWLVAFVILCMMLLGTFFVEPAHGDDEKMLLLVYRFFGQPVMYMNATPYMSVEACEESAKILVVPPQVEPDWYCEWVPKRSEYMPDLKSAKFTRKQQRILDDLAKELGVVNER